MSQQVTVSSECERLSVAELREWLAEIEAEALDAFGNCELGRLRRERDQVLSAIALHTGAVK